MIDYFGMAPISVRVGSKLTELKQQVSRVKA